MENCKLCGLEGAGRRKLEILKPYQYNELTFLTGPMTKTDEKVLDKLLKKCGVMHYDIICVTECGSSANEWNAWSCWEKTKDRICRKRNPVFVCMGNLPSAMIVGPDVNVWDNRGSVFNIPTRLNCIGKVKIDTETGRPPENNRRRKGIEEEHLTIDTPQMSGLITIDVDTLRRSGFANVEYFIADIQRANMIALGGSLKNPLSISGLGENSEAAEMMDSSDLIYLDFECSGFLPFIIGVGDELDIWSCKTNLVVWDALARFVGNPNKTVVAHNAAFEKRVLEKNKVDVKCNWYCTMRAQEVLYPNHLIALNHCLSGIYNIAFVNWKNRELCRNIYHYNSIDVFACREVRRNQISRSRNIGLEKGLAFHSQMRKMGWKTWEDVPNSD